MYYCKEGMQKIETRLQCLQYLIGIGIDWYILCPAVRLVLNWTTTTSFCFIITIIYFIFLFFIPILKKKLQLWLPELYRKNMAV